MKAKVLVVAVAVASAMSGSAGAGVVSTVEVALTFNVVNSNTSDVPCTPDGLPYRLSGYLVAPVNELNRGEIDAVTLYVAGSGDGSSWHFRSVPGYDHITEMARLGHASVFVHYLGYGTSDIPDGFAVCQGSLADMVHQVIEALRSGDYLAQGRDAPRFARVALAGHSGGGIVAQNEAISYSDVDALVVIGWADYPPDTVLYPAEARAQPRCAQGGEPKREGAPGGYSYGFTEDSEWEVLFHNADPAVAGAFRLAYERDSCGVLQTGGQGVAIDLIGAHTVTSPVLVAYGDRDIFLGGAGIAAETMRARYALGSDDVSVAIIPDAGHMVMLERNAGAFRAALSSWLLARGF